MSNSIDFFKKKKKFLSIFLVFCALGSLMFCKKISKSSLVITNSEVSEALKPGAEITTVLFKEGSSDISGTSFTVSGGDEIQMNNKSSTASIRLKPNTSLKGKQSISFRVQAKAKNGNKNFEANQDFSVKVNPAVIVCRRENNEDIYFGLQVGAVLVKCSLEDKRGDILTLGNIINYRLVDGNEGIDNNAVTFRNGEIKVKDPALLGNKTFLNIFIEISDDRYLWQQKIELPLKNFTVDIDEKLVYSELADNENIANIAVNYPDRNLPEVIFSDLQYSTDNTTWSSTNHKEYVLSPDPDKKNQTIIKNNQLKQLTSTHIYFKVKMKINNNVELTKTFEFSVLRIIFKSTIAEESKNATHHKYIPYQINNTDVVGKFTIFNGTDNITKDVEITSNTSNCSFGYSCTDLLKVSKEISPFKINLVRNNEDSSIDENAPLIFDTSKKIYIGIKMKYSEKEYKSVLFLETLAIRTDGNRQFSKTNPNNNTVMFNIESLTLGTSNTTFNIGTVSYNTSENDTEENWNNNSEKCFNFTMNIPNNKQNLLSLQSVCDEVGSSARIKIQIKAVIGTNIVNDQFSIQEIFDFTLSDFTLSLTDESWYKSFMADATQSTFLGTISLKKANGEKLDDVKFTLTNQSTSKASLVLENNELQIKSTSKISWSGFNEIYVQIAATLSSVGKPIFVSVTKKLKDEPDFKSITAPLFQSSGPNTLVATVTPPDNMDIENLSVTFTNDTKTRLKFHDNKKQILLSQNVASTQDQSLSRLNSLTFKVNYLFSVQTINAKRQYHSITQDKNITIQGSKLILDNPAVMKFVYNKSSNDVNILKINGIQDGNNQTSATNLEYSIVDPNLQNDYKINGSTLQTSKDCSDKENTPNSSCNFFTTKLLLKTSSTSSIFPDESPQKVFFTELEINVFDVTVEKTIDCQDCKGLFKNSLSQNPLATFLVKENKRPTTDNISFKITDNFSKFVIDPEGIVSLKGAKGEYPVWDSDDEFSITVYIEKKIGDQKIYGKLETIKLQKQDVKLEIPGGYNDFNKQGDGFSLLKKSNDYNDWHGQSQFTKTCQLREYKNVPKQQFTNADVCFIFNCERFDVTTARAIVVMKPKNPKSELKYRDKFPTTQFVNTLMVYGTTYSSDNYYTLDERVRKFNYKNTEESVVPVYTDIADVTLNNFNSDHSILRIASVKTNDSNDCIFDSASGTMSCSLQIDGFNTNTNLQNNEYTFNGVALDCIDIRNPKITVNVIFNFAIYKALTGFRIAVAPYLEYVKMRPTADLANNNTTHTPTSKIYMPTDLGIIARHTKILQFIQNVNIKLKLFENNQSIELSNPIKISFNPTGVSLNTFTTTTDRVINLLELHPIEVNPKDIYNPLFNNVINSLGELHAKAIFVEKTYIQ